MGWDYVKKFNNQYVSTQDWVVIWLIVAMFVFGAACLCANWLTYGYPGNQYLPMVWLCLLPFMLAMLGVSWWAKEMAPRLCHFTRFYTFYYLIILAMGVQLNGIQLTPFPTIDHVLANWDQALHVNTPAILAWSAHHKTLRLMLEIGYSAITWQLFFLSAILALFKNQRYVNEYLFLVCFVTLVSGVIYYFFPTAAPSSVFHSSHFIVDEHATALKFFQIHHFIKPTTSDGGLIAFPSDHVLFALMCLYVTRTKLWLFIPLLVINIVGIFATVILGWHYLIDVFGSILIFVLSVSLLCYLQKRFKY